MLWLPIPAWIKVFRDGVLVAESNDSKFAYTPKEPGVYRLEAWLHIDNEDRPWIYTNPIYVTKASTLALPPTTMATNVEDQKAVHHLHRWR